MQMHMCRRPHDAAVGREMRDTRCGVRDGIARPGAAGPRRAGRTGGQLLGSCADRVRKVPTYLSVPGMAHSQRPAKGAD